MNILINHIGYDSRATKIAAAALSRDQFPGPEAGFRLVQDGRTLLSSGPGDRLSVSGWKDRFYYIFDFSSVEKDGQYRIVFEDAGMRAESPEFIIRNGLLEDKCISDLLFYFKSQRCGWRWDRADQQVPFFGDRSDRVDVSGGWYDASGDYSKYLTHLSYAEYMNPQQTPIVVWSLFKLFDNLQQDEAMKTSLLAERALEEGCHGADFLCRMQDPEGYFYQTVFDGWSKDTESRRIASFRGMEGELSDRYKAGFRQGAGMAVAALARAAGTAGPGSAERTRYLTAAARGWTHLLENSTGYLDNGRENIIDHYCALIAAVELYRSTGDDPYLTAARLRASALRRLYRADGYWLVEESSSRPYFHAAEAGLPIIALVEYCGIEPDSSLREDAAGLIRTAVTDIIGITGTRESNPFLLAKQWVKPLNGELRKSYFMPHENETGYWWQGENARLASLAAAVRAAGPFFKPGQHKALNDFSDAQLDWILGFNPFDICMMQGQGRNNPRYEEHYPNAPGGICNGITAGFRDENDIDFLPTELEGRGDHRWRWSEQWIPHAAWFILALSTGRIE